MYNIHTHIHIYIHTYIHFRLCRKQPTNVLQHVFVLSWFVYCLLSCCRLPASRQAWPTAAAAVSLQAVAAVCRRTWRCLGTHLCSRRQRSCQRPLNLRRLSRRKRGTGAAVSTSRCSRALCTWIKTLVKSVSTEMLIKNLCRFDLRCESFGDGFVIWNLVNGDMMCGSKGWKQLQSVPNAISARLCSECGAGVVFRLAVCSPEGGCCASGNKGCM